MYSVSQLSFVNHVLSDYDCGNKASASREIVSSQKVFHDFGCKRKKKVHYIKMACRDAREMFLFL